MIEVGSVLVHEDIIEREFVCNLKKCRGICCVEGDAGAPLLDSELAILEEIYPKVKPYMTASGIKAVEEQGTHVVDIDGDLATPCVDGNRECAYVMWDNGITKCAIEKAFERGDIDYQKPISCHLYPIRATHYPDFHILNYDRWSICSDACTLGKELAVPIYKFLRDPLIREYGEEWYRELENIIESQ